MADRKAGQQIRGSADAWPDLHMPLTEFHQFQFRMSHCTGLKVLRKSKQSRMWHELHAECSLEAVSLTLPSCPAVSESGEKYYLIHSSFYTIQTFRKRLFHRKSWTSLSTSLKFTCVYQPQWSDFFGFPLLHPSGSLQPSRSLMRGSMAVRGSTELLLKVHNLMWVFHAERMHLTLPNTVYSNFSYLYRNKTESSKPWISSQYILFSTVWSCVCSRAQKLFKSRQKKLKRYRQI